MNTVKNRVELHVHLEGAIKHETIHELLKKSNVKIPGDGSLKAVQKYLITTDPTDLSHFLTPLGIVVPLLQNNEVAERVAYEFSQEASRNNVRYVEVRYSPHNFVPPQKETANMTAMIDAIRAIHRGFNRAEREFAVKTRSILCGFNGDDTIRDALELCKIFKNEGVVGLDMAAKQLSDQSLDEVMLNPVAVQVFEEARKSGIHRTMHAGERGGPDMVQRALDQFHSERIGHGYHVLANKDVYERCLRDRVHFECCPWSSYLTGSVQKKRKNHPIGRFAKDGLNFSINSDDPTLTGHWLADDYSLAQEMGLNDETFEICNLNAANSCFLPEAEKNELKRELEIIYKK